MHAQQRVLFALMSTLALTAVSCGRESAPAAKLADPLDPFEQTLMIGEIHGLATGAAYVTSFRGIYYVDRGVAEKVAGLPEDTLGELIALADGSALYNLGFGDPPKLFWLRGATADEVTEGRAPLAAIGATGNEGFWFAETQRLARELVEVESELEIGETDDGYYDDAERYN